MTTAASDQTGRCAGLRAGLDSAIGFVVASRKSGTSRSGDRLVAKGVVRASADRRQKGSWERPRTEVIASCALCLAARGRLGGRLAMIPAIAKWNGEQVPVRRSRGGVLTFERWEDNVLGGPPWPDALLTQVRGYVARPSHFADEDVGALAAHLDGRISKFQSINSEDAVTFSWFGTLAFASADSRRAAVQWLCDRTGIRAEANAPTIDQWSRVFHPNAPKSPKVQNLTHASTTQVLRSSTSRRSGTPRSAPERAKPSMYPMTRSFSDATPSG
jgi:hypothetical protein